VAAGDTIFISARLSTGWQGAESLVAAQRLEADSFPRAFSLGPEDAMLPGAAFRGPLTITVRVDKDGDPLTRRAGDLYGRAANVALGTAHLVIALDTLQADDVTLPSGRLVELPSGHP
jgi:hypothetical protein